jgi:hypothetical protein
VQSTTVLLMAIEGELERPDRAIFADTQWEPQAVYTHLAWLEGVAQAHQLPVYRVTSGDIRARILAQVPGKRIANPPLFIKNADGTKGMLRRGCTKSFKVEPITQKIRELLGVAKGRQVPTGMRVEQWFGISLDEAHRMRTAHVPWIVNVYPLIDRRMTRQDCLRWLDRHGYPTQPKSACIGCPYHNDEMWRQIRTADPAAWTEAVAFDAAIRRGLRGMRGEAYLHRARVPLDQVDLSSRTDHVQLNQFGNECEGLCGV